jgi:mannose-6-phosphate isomerase class I
VTQNPPLYPLLLNPALHLRVWGGRRLETVMHKKLPTDEPYGESWELHDTGLWRMALSGKKVSKYCPSMERSFAAKERPALGMPLASF